MIAAAQLRSTQFLLRHPQALGLEGSLNDTDPDSPNWLLVQLPVREYREKPPWEASSFSSQEKAAVFDARRDESARGRRSGLVSRRHSKTRWGHRPSVCLGPHTTRCTPELPRCLPAAGTALRTAVRYLGQARKARLPFIRSAYSRLQGLLCDGGAGSASPAPSTFLQPTVITRAQLPHSPPTADPCLSAPLASQHRPSSPSRFSFTGNPPCRRGRSAAGAGGGHGHPDGRRGRRGADTAPSPAAAVVHCRNHSPLRPPARLTLTD